MQIESIIIGDELLYGRTQDANGYWLGNFLAQNGHALNKITIVQDDEEEIIQSLSKAMEKSQIVFLTGGLGPTKDDKTKRILGTFFDSEVARSEKAEAIVRENYQRIGKEWNQQTNDYNFIPVDFTVVTNPQGLAPGLISPPRNGSQIFAGPGVPHEFRTMMSDVFWPYIKHHYSLEESKVVKEVIRTTGVPEEKIFGELCPELWDALSKKAKVSSLPDTSGIDIVLRHHGPLFNLNREKFVKLFPEGKNLLSSIWQFGGQSIEEYIIATLAKRKETIAFAESCTGGLAASSLTNISGSSDVVRGGMVTYTNDVKELLGVNPETLKQHKAVSPQTATEMAEAAIKQFKASWGISFTGYASPEGDDTHSGGTAFIAIAGSKMSETLVKEIRYPHLANNRVLLKQKFVHRSLLELNKILNS